MTVIELGEFTSGSQQSRPREFDARILRRIILAALVALTLLAATGSARPEPRGIRPLWSIPFRLPDRFTATADSVYAATAGSGVLVAYDIADGSERWSMPLPEPTGWPTVSAAAGVLMLPADRVGEQVTADDGSSYFDEHYRSTIAVDARTGARLWQQPGDVYAATDGLALLADRGPHGTLYRDLRAVRLRDGAVVWTRLGVNAEGLTTGGPDPLRPGMLVAVRSGGAAEVIRLADGVRVAAGRVDWHTPGPPAPGIVDLFADGGHAYVRIAGTGGLSLTAYALGTLRQSWRVDDTARVAAYSCGPVVCSIEGDGYAAYDPDTGATRWRAAGVGDVRYTRNGRLLADEGVADVYAVLDATTGARIASLGFGVPVWDERRGTGFLLHNTVSPAGRTAVSRVDLVTGAVALRGTVDRITDLLCAVSGDRLVCPTNAGRLSVTAVG